jgi:small subunit ribosomal protein S21
VQVFVRDNNVDQGLKVLKKKIQREGIFREMRLRGHYEKPSEKKTREKAEANRRVPALPGAASFGGRFATVPHQRAVTENPLLPRSNTGSLKM